MGPVIVNTAVDSLYCSFDSEVTEGVFSVLEYMQHEAKQEQAPEPIEFDDQKLLIKPYGSQGYMYQLNHENYLLKVSTSENMPTLYFQVYAHCLYELGHRRAWEQLASVAKYLGVGGNPKTSRIDLCVDFQGWRPSRHRMKDFVTQARKRRLYLEVDEATGYQFGTSGAVMARMYNKTEEIEVSKKQWMKEVWRQNPNYDESKAVWRLEFQFRREALKQCGCLTVEDTFEHLLGLFEYGMKWLSLRQPTANRKERSPVDRKWEALMKAEFPGVSCERVREAKEQASRSVLIRGYAGYLSSLGAHYRTADPEEAMHLAWFDVRAYYARKRTTFADVVNEKLEKDPSYRHDKQLI